MAILRPSSLLYFFCIFLSLSFSFIAEAKDEKAPRRGLLTYDQLKGQPYTVTYDKRSLIVAGKRTLFLSGSIHPPRVSVGSWLPVLQMAKQNGLNMIQVYTFWNYHRPTEGSDIWEGNANLKAFIELCGEMGLFVNLRLGPYVCAEWNYGGLPAWLGLKDGMEFRTYNTLWISYLSDWIKTLVGNLDGLFAHQGGPIVLAQIENEYYGGSDPDNQKYVQWCGQFASQLNLSIPWLMCNGDSAPNTINTCNDVDCVSFLNSHGQSGRILVDQPALWTENEGGFQVWGGSPSNPTSYFWGRSAEDAAYSVARWFARGGSHMNYYMYYGGNHYGPWNGNGITTMYASDVNICPDLLPHEPKYSHLEELHMILAKFGNTILSNDAQLKSPVRLPFYNPVTRRFENGTNQNAFIYKGSPGLIFMENSGSTAVLTQFNKVNFTLPAYSVSLVDGNLNILYNTADVLPAKTHRVTRPVISTPFNWKSWREPFNPDVVSFYPHLDYASPTEQLSATFQVYGKDPVLSQSPYIWYETQPRLISGGVLRIQAPKTMSFVAFVDGQYQSSTADLSHDDDGVITYSLPMVFPDDHAGWVSLLVENLGNINYPIEPKSTGQPRGITGSLKFYPSDGTPTVDVTKISWRSRPALVGEILEVYTTQGSSSVNWTANANSATPGTWLQTTFQVPSEHMNSGSLLFSAVGLGRGFAYVNGYNIGRYFPISMNDNSGRRTQQYYHIPWDWITSGTNTLTIFEGMGATDISSPRLMVSNMVSVMSLSEEERRNLQDSGINSCGL